MSSTMKCNTLRGRKKGKAAYLILLIPHDKELPDETFYP